MFAVPPFADNEEHFVFESIGQRDTTQLQAAHPPSHVFLTHGVEHVAEFVFLLCRIAIGRSADVTVQLFIVVILYLLAHSCQQTFFLAHFVLSAAFHVYGVYFWQLFYFSAFHFLLQLPVAYPSHQGGQYSQGEQSYDEYPHIYTLGL